MCAKSHAQSSVLVEKCKAFLSEFFQFGSVFRILGVAGSRNGFIGCQNWDVLQVACNSY